MLKNEGCARLLLEVAYFICCFGILSWFSYRDLFCSRPGGPSHAVITARLATACTAWDTVAGAAAALSVAATRKHRWIPLAVSTSVSWLGFRSIPSWIYRGYGHFLFENTWADVSCFFTEGYGMAFPLVVAPALGALTLLREWAALIISRRNAPSAIK